MITGAFRTVDKKQTRAELTVLSKQIIKAAEGGTVDQAGIKEFLKIAKIDKNYYDDPLGTANPKQRRNAGAPTTDTILQQMGNQAFSLYTPLDGMDGIPKGK